MAHDTFRTQWLRISTLAAVFAAGPAFASGDLDPEFGSGGKTVVDLGGSSEHPNAMLRDGDGNLYLAGGSGSGGTADFAILKLDAHGAPVAAFGDGGKVVIDMGGIDGANAMARDGAGNLFVCGSAGDETGAADFALVKLDANGNPVSAFGSGGKVMVDLGGSDHCTSVLLDAAGNVFLAGGSSVYAGFAVAVKLDSEGDLVSSYGTAGIAAAQMLTDTAALAAMDDQGRIVATGFRSFGPTGGGQLTVARLDATGHQDGSFGTGGATLIYLDAGDRTTETGPGGIALDASGHIYVSGYTDASQAGYFDLVVVKLDDDGQLDAAFGNAGIAIRELPDTDEFGSGVAVDRAGRSVYAAGTRYGSEGADFLVVAMGADDGAPLADFADGGIATIDFGASDYATALTLSNDRLYVAGGTDDGSGDFAAAALRIGLPDPVFRDGFELQ